MQNKKKCSTRNAIRDAGNMRCRQQKKAAEHAEVIVEGKVADLITSARKHKSGQMIAETRPRGTMQASDCKMKCTTATNGTCFGDDRLSLRHKDLCVQSAEPGLGTLFSPSYHFQKDPVTDILKRVDFLDVFTEDDAYFYELKDMKENSSESSLESFTSPGKKHPSNNIVIESQFSTLDETDSLMCSEKASGGNLSGGFSAIYIDMQKSKVECNAESNENYPSAACVEVDDFDGVEFDPYLFIRHLPELSSLVPSFRPMLLPKQTRSCPSTTLVLDLDETLVHSSLEHCASADFSFTVNFNLMEHEVYVRCRPYLRDFMERVSSLFEIIVFTASQSIYAEQLLNMLDPERKFFRHRVFRDSCILVDGNYLKDLSILGRDLAHVIIVDNSPQAFGFQVDNGIPIPSWFHDPNDSALLELLPFLESLVDVDDVRPIIAKKYSLREKVASAADSFISFL